MISPTSPFARSARKAAIGFRNVDANQAERPHFAKHCAVEPMFGGAFLVMRGQLFGGEALCGLTEGFLLFVQRGVHRRPHELS
jgi:hypothetical protein